MKPICNRQLDHFPSNGRSAVLSINRHKTVIFKLFHTDLVLTSIIISITLHFWYRPVSRACVTDSGFTKSFFFCVEVARVSRQFLHQSSVLLALKIKMLSELRGDPVDVKSAQCWLRFTQTEES